MKKIDFSNKKLHRELFYKEALDNINLTTDDFEIEIDIRNCFIDYPATPHFIDSFLDHLMKINVSHKKLRILSSSLDNLEHYVLYYLVFESNFFDIRDKINTEQELESWKVKINEKLKQNQIELIIKTENKEFNYG